MKINSKPYGTSDFPEEYDVLKVVTLNKTDLRVGNNKYYHIEAHASRDRSRFRLYSRYGRVGQEGIEEERIPPTQTEENLFKTFDQLKKSKIGPRKGYVEVQLAATKIGSEVGNQQIFSEDIKKEKIVEEENEASVTLSPSIAKLVTRLYEEAGEAVRNQLSGSLKTTTENPLGTLTLTQIEKGRQTLQEIQKLIAGDNSLIGSIDKRILDLSNQFYSDIPQVLDKRPSTKEGKSAMNTWLRSIALNKASILDEKENLLDLLSDVQGVAKGFLSSDIGQKYRQIGCTFTECERGSKEFESSKSLVENTRSSHHDWKVEIKNVWKMSVQDQEEKNRSIFEKVGNVQRLFHGSRNQNILGICKNGLLKRPPGVYITGSMFGNGLYFADQSSKSEQYSTARFGGSGRDSDTFFLLIADVALGRIKQFDSAQTYLNEPPKGFDSVQGVKGYSLMHNEFIIYDIKQHVLNYLIEFKPKWGRW